MLETGQQFSHAKWPCGNRVPFSNGAKRAEILDLAVYLNSATRGLPIIQKLINPDIVCAALIWKMSRSPLELNFAI
jgi:hypothetical protein